MSVFALKGKSRFSLLKNLGFVLNANALDDSVHIEDKIPVFNRENWSFSLNADALKESVSIE